MKAELTNKESMEIWLGMFNAAMSGYLSRQGYDGPEAAEKAAVAADAGMRILGKKGYPSADSRFTKKCE